MNNYKTLGVFMDGQKVGTLAVAQNHFVAFEYDRDWLAEGYSISPLSLPLEKGVFMPKKYDPFEGLFGVFSDSLPDGWGRLLLDRLLLENKINPAEVDSMNRLAVVGTTKLTKDYREIEKLYRLMCFNVFAHNRDDHSKNFSYLYEQGRWQLSPAYDLTYSNSLGGEHATTIDGNGRNPSRKDLLAVAGKIGFDKAKAKNIADEVREIVEEDLGGYLESP